MQNYAQIFGLMIKEVITSESKLCIISITRRLMPLNMDLYLLRTDCYIMKVYYELPRLRGTT